MKKVLILTSAFLFIVMCLASTFVTSTNPTSQQVSAVAFSDIVANSIIEPLSYEGVAPTSDGPYDIVDVPVHSRSSTGAIRKIFWSEQTGILMSENYEPIADISGANTLVTTYDKANQNFINSREQTLAIYLDSRLNRHYLTGGGTAVTHINLDREIFLVNYKPSGQPERLIYCFRSERKLSWWDSLWTSGKVYDYFDMNGMKIEDKYIVDMKVAKWWQVGLSVIVPWSMLFKSVGVVMQYADIRERTTLGELHAYMYGAKHPWEKVNAITMDGYDVYINPRTRQLTDFYGFAIWNAVSGLPIIYWQGDIYTTDGQLQVITPTEILYDAFTVNALLENGMNFSIGTTITHFGTFDVPMFNSTGDIYNPDWTLLNGDSAKDVVLDGTHYAESIKGDSFFEWLGGIFSSVGGGIGSLFGGLGGALKSVVNWILIVIVIIILIFCFPLVVQLVKLLFQIVLAPIKWLAKKFGGQG